MRVGSGNGSQDAKDQARKRRGLEEAKHLGQSVMRHVIEKAFDIRSIGIRESLLLKVKDVL